MRKFFANKKLIIVMIILIATLSTVALSFRVRENRSAPPLIQRVANDISNTAAAIVSAPMVAIHDGFNNVTDLVNTYNENQALKKDITQWQQTKATNSTLKQENSQLKKQLKLNATLSDYKQIPASVTSRQPADWENIFMINKGSLQGVKKNMPVVSGAGLIGRVIEVNNISSKVELISTANTNADRTAVEIVNKKDEHINGIVSGYDKTDEALTMTQINTKNAIEKGDTVITSGLGGLTPKGLYVGKVVSVKNDDYGRPATVYLKPATNLNDFSVVTVISRDVQGG
ncbi:rod shape-determining protein MreC [Schleiferilactobacillus perolens]|jgi:rod shape-determining protein MreC|uniref:Cell shape-determining protein MreC n=1 Tax=Schleiferilactobacillus perolens DSM 12744 TaxID=1423792 RepID=A0A0R1N8P2_9LACO|nr:rod shape-determining protein MreC [Schleiferilactobacillus perolens]KRL14229.1 Cell shape-determining protein [Schleiferilactobacillus perolens DSM 12744]MCI2171976.1 rod shape-determining protein MreC [Schleiferilactobacillus perolens]